MESTSELTVDVNLKGKLLRPGDESYDEARAVWNGMVDRRPALIAQCVDADDVARAVTFAREAGLEISVKGGGHGVAGHAVVENGLMIDLKHMNAVDVDPAARIARVGAGASWGDFDRAAQAHGLGTTGGTDSRTGVAGLTLGGGLGFLMRKHGLAVDNLVAADVVTADGRQIRASQDEHADLFWALRGGGGNFGVVTSLDYELHDVGPEVMLAQAYYPVTAAAEILRSYRDYMASAPDDVTCLAVIMRVPPVDPFPPAHHGATVIALVACHAGALEDGAKALAPIAELGDAILSGVQPIAYTDLQHMFNAGFPDGERYYFKSTFARALDDKAIGAIVEAVDPLIGSLSVVAIESLGGAVGRVDGGATAFPYRGAAFNFSVFAGWSDAAADTDVITWAREVVGAVAHYADGGVYANYLSQEDDDRARDAFGENYSRLSQVKAAYDPDNVFHLNHNINPMK